MATQAKIDIKSAGGTTLLSTSINEGAKGYYSLMQHDYIMLPFKLRTPIDFKIGSYVDLRGVFDDALGGKLAKMYYVTELQNPSYNTSTGAYEYQLRLNAYYWLWNNFVFKYTPESTAGEASWSLTAPLDVQLGVFLRNLSELGFTYNGVPYEYSIDSTVENKAVAMTYDNTRLLDALFSMGGENAWDCDVWVTENVIHFGRCEHGDAVKIEIGVEASDMTRNESRGTFATRIYAFGSTRNIPENYRETGNPDLTVNGIVQKRLMLPADTPYIDAYPDMQPFEVVESVVVFDDIYPKRIGTLSDVKTVDRAIEDGEGNQAGTFKAYQYKDTGLTFDEEYILEGQELRIVFQSGKLNGLDFGVTFNPEGADPAEQLWEIVANEDYGRRLPDEVMKPENGDKYILYGFNIKLVSDQYVPSAEQELKERAQAYVNMTKVDDGTYTVPLRASYVREDMISRTYDVGQKVNLVNPSFFGEEGRISRVIGWEMCLDIPSDNPVYTIGESAQYSRLTEIEDKVDSLVFNGQTYQGTGGGSGVYVIRTNDSTPASDTNVFSALRSLATFLRKDKEESTNYLLRMLGGAHFFPFTQGMIGGSGAAFYKNAAGKVYMEADGAYLRDELIVPKITFNCIDVISGDKANTFAFGTIKSVDTDNKTAELDLLEDQAGTLHVDDICRGVFHNIDGGNQRDDMEDDNGFYGYAGFSTSYFTPTEIITNEPGRMVFRYSLQAGTSVHPMKGMNFFAYGNFTDKTRQSITYETRYYTRRLKDVNTWVIDPTKNISMQDGLLEGLTIGGMVMHGYGTFQENCYFTGVNIQFTPETEDALKGQDAYNVSLSSYERAVKVDENGDLSVLAITTYIQAFKGETELLYSTSVEPGKYIASLNAHGCTAHIDAGSVIIDSITDYNNCYIDIEVNCEGNVVFNKTFSISFIRDGKDGYEGSSPVVIDLDNEMSSVACNAEGDIVAGLPVKSGVAVYKGTEALEISEVVAEAPEGVTCSVDEETHSVTVSAIGKEVAESFGITVTATADDDGVPVTRSTVMTILKVKAGENATLYRLVPSVNVIKIDKEGNYSESYVACSVSRINGKEMETLSALPEGFTMTVRKDGLAETAYSLNDDIVTSGLVRSVEFRLKKGDVLIDAETIPFVADGVDGLSSITLDLDNEMASVACDTEGNVVNGLPIAVKFSMYFGTEEMEITSVTNTFITGLVITNSASEAKSTITSISSSTPDTIELEYAVRGIYNSALYERKAVFRILKIQAGENGKDGKNAIVYQLLPSLNVIKVNKNGSYVNTSILCRLTKNDGGTVSTVTTLPAGLQMSFEKDDGSETQIGIGDVISVTNVSTKLVFRLYQDNVLADMETVPVVKDGQDGQDGRPGSDGRPGADGADGKQGIQGCVIRTSIWTTGREYRNDSTIDDDSVIRYIDVAMVRNNSYSTGWRAYLCLRTHTSSSSIGVSNTTYWSEFSQNVTAILTDLIIAKNAQLQFMQGNRLLIQKDDGTITAGISGSTSGNKIRFWAGAEEPDNAPFRVDEEGNLIAQNGRFEGVIAGTLESLNTAGGEIDLDADKAWFNGIDLQNQGTVGGRPLRFYSSSIWCRNQFGAYGRIMARVLTNTVYYYPNGTDMATTIYNMTAKTSSSGQRYYSIPCFGGGVLDDTPDNIAGMPVDTIVLSNTGSYYYELELGPTQRVFIIHANDDASSGSYIYVNGQAVVVQGGGSIIVQAIPSAWVKPSVASSTLGANQIVISEHDFNW